MALELRQLRHVLALAHHGSLGRAAAALHMTQPALSRSLKLIEWETGSVLFTRSAKGVMPTDQGQLLIRRARELVDAADELDREVVRQRVGGSGQLHLGAGPYPAETVVSDALTRFVASHDAVRVRVTVTGTLHELPKLLRAHQIDFFVADHSTFADQDDLDIRPLERHPAYVVARAGHPLLASMPLSLFALFTYPFVAVSQYPPRALQPMLALRQPAEARKPGRPFPAVEFASLAAVKSIVAASDSIAAMTLQSARDELRRGTLVVLGTAPWSYVHYAVVTLKGQRLSGAASEFIDMLGEAEAGVLRNESRLAERYDPAANRKGPPRRRTSAGTAARAGRPF
jgi:DNA-binding transcriptional LysR family regulator